MNIKRVMIIGTMIVAMSFGSNAWARPALVASPVAKFSVADTENKDDLLDALNQASDEELYEQLYNGHSLQDIAAGRGGDIGKVINLQTAELAAQLGQRLASGSISLEQYDAHMAELHEVVSRSVATAFAY